MRETTFIEQVGQLQYHTIIGSGAFILTAVYLLVRFALYPKMIIEGAPPKKSLLIVYFIVSVSAKLSWLIYLWHLGNLYVQVGLSLHIISSFIFLIQTRWFLNRSKNARRHAENP